MKDYVKHIDSDKIKNLLKKANDHRKSLEIIAVKKPSIKGKTDEIRTLKVQTKKIEIPSLSQGDTGNFMKDIVPYLRTYDADPEKLSAASPWKTRAQIVKALNSLKRKIMKSQDPELLDVLEII